MRRLITILLLALYALTSIGVHGVSHFCGDVLVGVAFFNQPEEMDCGADACCNIPDDDPECCTDLKFSVLYESERTFANVLHRPDLKTPIQPALLFLFPDVFNSLVLESQPTLSVETDPVESPPFYITHQSLIFYG